MKKLNYGKACVLESNVDFIYGEGIEQDLKDSIQDGINDCMNSEISVEELAEEIYTDYVISILPEPRFKGRYSKEDFINYILVDIEIFIAGTV